MEDFLRFTIDNQSYVTVKLTASFSVPSLPPSLQISDISTRRRLSTPKASPALPKRTASQKSYKSSTGSEQPKLSWFKSLDRLSRKKDKREPVVAVSPTRTSSVEERMTVGPRKTSREDPRASLPPQAVKGGSSKTLRFFGDTDLESNGSYSKAAWKNK